MSDNTPQAKISIGDVYFVIFRHKWKILIFSAAGFLAAVALYLFFPQAYQSEAELYIRYVEEGKPLSSPGNDANAVLPDGRSGSIIQTEVKILESADVMPAVVQDIGADKILAKAGGGNDPNKAAGIIAKNLMIEPDPAASVIKITFRHPDSQIVQPVLNEIIDSYFKKHAQVRNGGMVFNHFLVQETNRLHDEQIQTEKALQEAKNKVGVISVDDAKKGYEQQIAQIREELFTAQAELAEHEGMLKETTGLLPSIPQTSATPKASNVEAQIPSAKVDQYQNICTRLDLLKKKEQEFLFQGYTDENVLVQGVRAQITQNEVIKNKLEQEDPGLTEIDVALPMTVGPVDHSLISAANESVQIAALNAKIKVLNSQLSQVQNQAMALDSAAGTISALERKKQSEEANFEYFSRNLEQSRIDSVLGDGNAPIGIIQSPSLPVRERPKYFKKMVLGVMFGGFAGGLALAFFIEFFWDRSVKRPADIEAKLRLPLFITIPDITQNGHHSLLQTTRGKLLPLNGSGVGKNDVPEEIAMAPWNRNHPLRRFCEGLRDRLMTYFEVKDIRHNPKLVAVTSCDKSAGVSSIAAGLAASLSETGEGNVLLVSMSRDEGVGLQFHKGQMRCDLDDALEAHTKKEALINGNFYAVTERADGGQMSSTLPKRLKNLIPKLKASDYDYIIFDMPPVGQTSATVRLAGLMDMVLLVIESEKTNQDVVKRVNQLLLESKAKVGIVLNKTRNYVPLRLQREYLNDI